MQQIAKLQLHQDKTDYIETEKGLTAVTAASPATRAPSWGLPFSSWPSRMGGMATSTGGIQQQCKSCACSCTLQCIKQHKGLDIQVSVVNRQPKLQAAPQHTALHRMHNGGAPADSQKSTPRAPTAPDWVMHDKYITSSSTPTHDGAEPF